MRFPWHPRALSPDNGTCLVPAAVYVSLLYVEPCLHLPCPCDRSSALLPSGTGALPGGQHGESRRTSCSDDDSIAALHQSRRSSAAAGAMAAPVQLLSEAPQAAETAAREDAEVLPRSVERADRFVTVTDAVRPVTEAEPVQLRLRALLQTSEAAMVAADVDMVMQHATAPHKAAADQPLSVSSPREVLEAVPAVLGHSEPVHADSTHGAIHPLRQRIIRRPSTCVSEPDISRALYTVVSACGTMAPLATVLMVLLDRLAVLC